MANDDRYFEDRQGWVNDHSDWLERDVREFRRRLAPLSNNNPGWVSGADRPSPHRVAG